MQHKMKMAAPHSMDMSSHSMDMEMGAHTMQGVPIWMAMVGIGLIIVLTHFFLFWLRRREKLATGGSAEYNKLNILRFGPLRRMVKSHYFPLIAQSISVLLLLLILATGLFGSQRSDSNISVILTWTWWWTLLIFFIVGFGKLFCTICPWEAISSLVTSLSLKSRHKKIGFEMKWPKQFKNIYPAIILFIVLTWLDLGFEVTNSPLATANLAVIMVVMAALSAVVFEKRAFCRYACLVGRISGLYSLFSPFELRPESKAVCKSCDDKTCMDGTKADTGCPTFLFPGGLKENTYCTLCTECVRSCSQDNIAINIRPPAQDLMPKQKMRADETILAIVLLAITSFHGLTMTPLWTEIMNGIRAATGLGPKVTFSILMGIMMLIPFLLFWGTAYIGKVLNGNKEELKTMLKVFAYPVIPVALFYHLAHNGMHFFVEADKIVPLLSDPFGWNWNLFGTADYQTGSMLSMTSIWWIQTILIVVGHVYGVIVAEKTIRRFLNKDGSRTKLVLIPLMVTMILYSSFSIWLIAQPMVMRSGM